MREGFARFCAKLDQIEHGGPQLTPGPVNSLSSPFLTVGNTFNIGPNSPLRAFSKAQSAGLASGSEIAQTDPAESVPLTPLGHRLAHATLQAAADNKNLKNASATIS